MGPRARTKWIPQPLVISRKRVSLGGMQSANTDMGRRRTHQSSTTALFVAATLLCGGGLLLAAGQPVGIGWGLLVIGAAFLAAAPGLTRDGRGAQSNPYCVGSSASSGRLRRQRASDHATSRACRGRRRT
jgi:hypothetical protein